MPDPGRHRRDLPPLLVEPCALCGAVADATGLCKVCRAALPRVQQPCPVCGISRHQPWAKHPQGWFFGRVWAPFQYRFPMPQLIHRLKYRGQQQLGYGLGLLLAEDLPLEQDENTVLIPIPLHRQRLIERGYNQSFELARGIAAARGLPVWLSGISRRRPTSFQAGLSQRQRQHNVDKAFLAQRRMSRVHIWLVDDVITTGATGNALAGALLEAGAQRVSITALARG